MPQLTRSASLTGFAELARALGLDPIRLAAAAEVPTRALDEPDLQIPIEGVARLLNVAAARSGREDFGLRLAENRRLSNLGPVGLIARDQPSLREALEVMAQYQWLHNDAVSLRLDEMDDIAVARLDFAAGGRPVSRQAADLSVGVLCVNIRGLVGGQWRPQAVMFRHGAPADLATYRRVFGVTPEFHHGFDGLVLSRADLDAPLRAADPAMARQVQRYVDQLAQGRRRTTRETVGDLVVLLLPTGSCTADRIAAHLGCDRRTLHRRLAREGCSFTELVAERRADLAASLIDDGRSLAAAADLTGFSSASSFSHWFRRRFGRAPRTWRAERRAGRPAT
jgi:AraC-like DNA-binding protein